MPADRTQNAAEAAVRDGGFGLQSNCPSEFRLSLLVPTLLDKQDSEAGVW